MTLGGYVLAGGQSTRMGTDKALLELDGEPLAARAVRTLSEVCARVRIAGGAPELARYAPVLPERFAGRGPLSGIVAALEDTAHEWNAVLAVDVPFLPASVFRMLHAWADGSEAVAVLPIVDGREQPLCGLYARAALPGILAELEAGTGKVTRALDRAGIVHLMPFDQPAWFRNLNTPADLAAARAGAVPLRHGG